jgi:hypothetical protein
MFGAARGLAKVFGTRVVRRQSRNSGQVFSSPRGRRLRLESLEDRRLLAIGDLLQSIVDPGTIDVQPASRFGYAVATDGDLTVVGVPFGDVDGTYNVGLAYVFNTSTDELLATLDNPTPAQNDYFGISVAISGNTAVVGAYCDDTGASDAGAAYVFNATTGELVSTLANPTPVASDNFGYSVSVSGDTVVVGAQYDDTTATDAGSAYVFQASTGTLVTTLANPTPAADDRFGRSVAISGSLVVAGSYYDDTLATNAGTAYVFNATTGDLVSTLANPAPTSNDVFGYAVAISGSTVAVTATQDDTGGGDVGRAYVFNATTGALQWALNNPNPTNSVYMGQSIAISGDTVVVGTAYDNTEGAVSGVAHVFDASTGELLRTLDNPTPAADDHFGWSVSVSGDNVVVGAYYDDTDAPNAGSAYLFDAATGGLALMLANPTPNYADEFGRSVAIAGDLMVVGAYGNDTTESNSGVAYVYNASTGSLLSTLINPTLADGDSFGYAVAISGNTVVVSAPNDDTAVSNAGAAYVFNALTGELLTTLNNPDPTANDYFGRAVAIDGDTVVVGDYYDDTTGSNSGSAYVFSASTGGLIATLANPTPATDDYFGFSVAISGDTVVVGTYYEDTGATHAGAAYLFSASTGELLATIANPTPATADHFGCAVAIADGTVVVAANVDDTGAANAGSVYLFDADTATLLYTLLNPAPEVDDYFGYSVAISGNTLLVGAPFDDTGGSDCGEAYLYDVSTGTLLATLANPLADANDNFGYSAAMSDGKSVVGARYDNTTMFNGGAAFVFDANQAPTAIDLSGSTVPENSATGTTVGTLSTTDPDVGETFTYTLLDSADGRFAIDGDQLVVDDGSLLDYETATEHVIVVQTTDAHGASFQQQFTITLTDANDAPTAIALSNNAVAENCDDGTLVGALTTTDHDSAGPFTYTLLDNAGGRFTIDGDQLLVTDGTLFNYETATSYKITVRTTDEGGLTHTQDLTIRVTDVNETPTDITLNATSVAENQAVGTVIGTLDSVDVDMPLVVGADPSYRLVDGAGGEDNSWFRLQVEHFVDVTTYRLVSNAAFDYEADSTYSIRVRVTDLGGLSYEKTFTITVTDVNEAPTDITLSATSVAENAAVGTVVGTFDSEDPDVTMIVGGAPFTYALVDGDGATDNGSFSIVENNFYGMIIYKLVTNAALDYETQNTFSIRVRSTDRDGLSCEKVLTVDLSNVHDFDSVAVYDPSTSMFYLLGENASGSADYAFGYGAANAGWTTLVGDWDGNGTSDAGLFDPATSTFYLTDAYQTGVAQYTFGYGVPDAGWIPLVGDWDGNGTSGVGLFDPTNSTFYLTDTLATGMAEYTFGYGVPNAGWEPIVGDWNGTGSTGVGLYDPHSSCFYLTATLAAGYAEYTFGYGVPDAGWQPLVGDWNGNGTTGVGLYDPAGSTFYLTDTLATGSAENTFAYGVPDGGWTPLVGDWNGNGADGVGLYDPAGTTFYLSNALQTGVAEHTVQIAEASSGCVPLVGCWTQIEQPVSAAAVDQVDVADVAAQELASLDNAGSLCDSNGSADAIDRALATL